MATEDIILAIDQGTTGTTALLMAPNGAVLGRSNCEFRQHFPGEGWVEHDPMEIWESVSKAIQQALVEASCRPEAIAAIGLTNQRETALVWERSSGRPIHHAIVWQDRRTSQRCDVLLAAGAEPEIQRLTGLVVDPYFSCTKVEWLLDNVPGARSRAERGGLCFGTVDSYLLWKLSGSGGTSGLHVTDVTNASRTGLMDLARLDWSQPMLDLFRVPRAMLPRIVPCSGQVATTRSVPGLPDGIPITGVAGDQQAALFGQACFEVGEAKCTYGTGAFVLVQTGPKLVRSRSRLISTVAWQLGDEVSYAIEGSAFVAGAAIQWLRDGLRVLPDAASSATLAEAVPSSGGVLFVPALAGLGAPYWDPDARGAITGIHRGTTLAHIVRATLEGIGFQVDDLLQAMEQDLAHPLTRLRVDGGAAANDILLQFQADLSGLCVDRPELLESTARGAAMLAGLGVGLFTSPRQAAQMIRTEKSFMVHMGATERLSRRREWQEAIRRVSRRVTERDRS